MGFDINQKRWIPLNHCASIPARQMIYCRQIFGNVKQMKGAARMRTNWLKWVALALLLASVVVLMSGCGNNADYDQALDAFKAGDFAVVSQLFAQAPEGYKDRDFYLNTIAALDVFEGGDWLQAALLFAPLYQEAHDLYTRASKVDSKDIPTRKRAPTAPICCCRSMRGSTSHWTTR